MRVLPQASLIEEGDEVVVGLDVAAVVVVGLDVDVVVFVVELFAGEGGAEVSEKKK